MYPMERLSMKTKPDILFSIYDLVARFKLASPYRKYRTHNDEPYDPFFIVGSGRSGNTLLRRILNAHSELYIPPETYVLGKSIRQFRRYNNMPWKDLVHLIYSNFEFHHEFETFEIKTLAPLVNDVSHCDKQQRTLAYVLHRFYEFYAQAHRINKPRWGDKTPLNTFAIFSLSKVFPNAKFIHIVRDPYDVIHSYVQSGIYTSHTEAALRWAQSVRIAGKFKSKYPERCLEVYYERLTKDPENVIRTICSFLKIPFESQMLTSEKSAKELGDVKLREHHANVYMPINTDNIGKGRTAIDAYTNRTIEPIIGDCLKKFGYIPFAKHAKDEAQ